MSSSDVSGVSSFFSTAAEGFVTTTSGSISSGDTTVGLNSVSGLTNGNVFVGIIEPGVTGKEQVFTGLVDTAGSQVTSVVWTRGNNTAHAGGVTVVDYVTGTAHNMMVKGLLVAHSQDGTHKSGATYPLAIISDLTNMNHSHANSAGGGQLNAANALTDGSISGAKVAADAISDAKLIFGKLRSRQGGSASNWSTAGTTTFDYSATDVFIQAGTIANDASPKTITFPTAFSQVPIVVAWPTTAVGVNCYVSNVQATASNFTCQVVTDAGVANTAQTVSWLAIGQ